MFTLDYEALKNVCHNFTKDLFQLILIKVAFIKNIFYMCCHLCPQKSQQAIQYNNKITYNNNGL